MKEERCTKCDKKLGEFDGSYVVVCPRCKTHNEKIYDDKQRQELKMYMQEFEQGQEREEHYKSIIRQLNYANQQLDARNKELLQNNTYSDIIDV